MNDNMLTMLTAVEHEYLKLCKLTKPNKKLKYEECTTVYQCCCPWPWSLALTCPRGQILSPWPWPWGSSPWPWPWAKVLGPDQPGPWPCKLVFRETNTATILKAISSHEWLDSVCCRCKLPTRVMLCPLITVSCARRSQKPNCSKVSDCQMLQTSKSHPPVCSVPKCIRVCTWFWKNISIVKRNTLK